MNYLLIEERVNEEGSEKSNFKKRHSVTLKI